VTWYEAAAYAEFRGKQLPTIFQWEKAAREDIDNLNWGTTMPWGLTGLHEDVTDRANLMSRREGTTPVGSFEFGISPYGCYDMAGNVVEWCLNPRPIGFTTTASSWRDGPNLFSLYGEFPGLYSSEALGFRCVRNAPGATGDQGGMLLPDAEEEADYAPVPEEDFQLMRAHYEYDRPRLDDDDVNGDEQKLKERILEDLDARVVEEVETAGWRRIKISLIGAERKRTAGPVPEDKRALAYLWLPNNARPPFQVVNYKPGGPSYNGVTAPQETEIVCGPILMSGRAVLVTVIRGMRERDLPPDWVPPDEGSVAHRDMMIYDTLDQRRGLDYLETRDEIALDKIVCMGLSMGGYDLVTMAVEDRFQGVLLLSAGLGTGARRTIAAANPINFAPYIGGRKMMIHGRYDEGIPFRTGALPLYKLLSPPKEHAWLECGHLPEMDQWVPHALRFLDETLGPVETTRAASSVADRGQ
jgi:hypothetical protein